MKSKADKLKEEFTKETGIKDIEYWNEGMGSYVDEYVEWLENRAVVNGDETSQDQALNIACVSGSLPEVTLMNEQKLGDTFINWKELSPEKQWQRIDAMLHEIGLKVVRQ